MISMLDKVEPNFSSALIIDLNVIVDNFQTLSRQVAPAKIYPVVKANAYGLGMAKIAPALHEAGAQGFFVAQLNEAIELRQILPRTPIYVFYGLQPSQEATFSEYKLIPVLNTPGQWQIWGPTKLEAAMHIDTGLTRLGFPMENIPSNDSRINLVMSHLACSDEPTSPHNQLQLENFRSAISAFPHAAKSLAASGGAYLGKDYHFDIVRAGISLYGGNPQPERPSPVKTPVGLYAKLLQVKKAKKGDKVGYGATFTIPHDMTLGIVGYGYADGYLRSASSKGMAYLNGKPCPILGRISMDLMAIDLTDTDPRENDWVELIGENLSLDKVATSMCTISYEVITSLHTRAQPLYVETKDRDISHRKNLS